MDQVAQWLIKTTTAKMKELVEADQRRREVIVEIEDKEELSQMKMNMKTEEL